jgi:ATP-binding cassette subfamily F protein 3
VLEQANFLLLDEPTNHLDIASQEILQSALEAFDGTILLVTHDRYLVDRLASQIWELKEDEAGGTRLAVFKGPYQAFLAARAGKTTAEPPAPAAPAANGESAAPPRLSKNEQRRRAEAVAAVERGINETEAAMAALGEALQRAAAAQEYPELQRLTAEYAAAEARHDELFAEWEALTHEPADYRADG